MNIFWLDRKVVDVRGLRWVGSQLKIIICSRQMLLKVMGCYQNRRLMKTRLGRKSDSTKVEVVIEADDADEVY